MKSSKFVLVSFTFFYPESFKKDDEGNRIGDAYGKDKYNFTSGPFGTAIVSLSDPSIFMIVDRGMSSELDYFIEDSLVPSLRMNFGDGPYTPENLTSSKVQEDLSMQYTLDVGDIDAYIEIDVQSFNWGDMGKGDPSDRLKKLLVPNISPIDLLANMEANGVI